MAPHMPCWPCIGVCCFQAMICCLCLSTSDRAGASPPQGGDAKGCRFPDNRGNSQLSRDFVKSSACSHPVTIDVFRRDRGSTLDSEPSSRRQPQARTTIRAGARSAGDRVLFPAPPVLPQLVPAAPAEPLLEHFLACLGPLPRLPDPADPLCCRDSGAG
jgi:hypothetical protein